MNLNLAGKRALVTGGSRGIGKSVIDSFVEEGMSVATCARGEASLNASLAQWNKDKEMVYGQSVDVTDAGAFGSWVEDSVQTMGGLDVLVSNVTTRIG